MKPPRSRIVSVRVHISEYVELAAQAEAGNLTISGALLSGWRNWKSQQPLEETLQRIETAIAEARAENVHKFQRLADGLNQLIVGRK